MKAKTWVKRAKKLSFDTINIDDIDDLTAEERFIILSISAYIDNELADFDDLQQELKTKKI